MTLLDSIGLQDVKGMLQFRIRPDSDLLEAIQEALDREKVKAGVFVSGLGALKKAVFRNLRRFPEQYPVTPEDRIYLEVTSPMELVALSGWVAPRADGRPEIHAHLAASTVRDDDVVTLGGHLTTGTVCGIKVVVAMLVLDPHGLAAIEDTVTRTRDIRITGGDDEAGGR